MVSLQLEGELSCGFARLFAKAMKDNRTLMVLNLSSIHESGMKYLCNALQAGKRLVVLMLGGEFTFGSIDSLQLFCNSLNRITMLHLKLADGIIGEEIAKALKTNTSLSDLIFTDCKTYGAGLSNKAFQELSEALTLNKTLLKLELQDCGMNDEHCSTLMAALAKNTSVNTLHITSKHITNPYLPVANLLKVNSTLTDLLLSVAGFDEKGLQAFTEVMKTNTRMRSLAITTVAVEEVRAVADILKVNRSLTEVNLTKRYDENEGDDAYMYHLEEAGRLLGEALKNNDSVHSLQFWTDELETDLVKDDMIDLLASNKALTDLGPVDDVECPELIKLLEENKKEQEQNHAITQKAMLTIASSDQALDIFPQEIWLNIFKFINFPGRDYHARFDKTLASLFAFHQMKRTKAPPKNLSAGMLLDWLAVTMDLKQKEIDPLIVAGGDSYHKAISEMGSFLLSANF